MVFQLLFWEAHVTGCIIHFVWNFSVVIHFRGKSFRKREEVSWTDTWKNEKCLKYFLQKKRPLRIVVPLGFWPVSDASLPECLSMNESWQDPGNSAATLVILCMASGTTCRWRDWKTAVFLNLTSLYYSVQLDLYGAVHSSRERE